MVRTGCRRRIGHPVATTGAVVNRGRQGFGPPSARTRLRRQMQDLCPCPLSELQSPTLRPQAGRRQSRRRHFTGHHVAGCLLPPRFGFHPPAETRTRLQRWRLPGGGHPSTACPLPPAVVPQPILRQKLTWSVFPGHRLPSTVGRRIRPPPSTAGTASQPLFDRRDVLQPCSDVVSARCSGWLIVGRPLLKPLFH